MFSMIMHYVLVTLKPLSTFDFHIGPEICTYVFDSSQNSGFNAISEVLKKYVPLAKLTLI